MISIVDYGMGNIGSISNMLKKIGVKSQRVANPTLLEEAEKIILPGVGAFDHAMERLNAQGFSEVLRKKAAEGTSILGICLGMQLLGTRSEEGQLEGLNLIPGTIQRFPNGNGLRVPHMGWNKVKTKEGSMFEQLEVNKFYFVHSYYYVPEDEANIAGISNYGFEFVSCVQKDNIYGAQFHPEKSHKYGMQFLKNFAAI